MAKDENSVTPMMAQYLGIKQDYPDALLFYRMGDFYELFFEDSILAAEALDIALTKRGKHLGKDIAMCGVPVRAAETYLLALIKKGFRVAVCEQLEDPAEAKKRGYKAVVKRGVVRLVTPGTLTEESLLDARQHNFLCAYAEIREDSAVAWVDISTGDFFVQSCPKAAVSPLLARLSPNEILVSAQADEWLSQSIKDVGASETELAPSSFDSTSAIQRLQKLFGVSSLDAFGNFTRPELAAMGAIVDYLDITQKGNMPVIRRPVQESFNATMTIDAASRRNLELVRTIDGDKKNALLGVVDRTMTGAGARLMATRLASPSRDLEVINNRLEAVAFFVSNQSNKDHVRSILQHTPDIDRALSRLSLNRAGPRDLAAIRDGLLFAADILPHLTDGTLPSEIKSAVASLGGNEALANSLKSTLVKEPTLYIKDGNFIAAGIDTELDSCRILRDEGKSVITQMQKDYIEKTGIPALKVKHNRVLGYFIETPATHAQKMLAEPLSGFFMHRQTTANAVRFTTTDLAEMETKIFNAGNRVQEIEQRIFEEMRQEILNNAPQIATLARALAFIDFYAALADLAIKEDWVKPSVTNDRSFHIVKGRHPVVEAALRREGKSVFVANDCDLSVESGNEKPLWLLTGPNMAGKSTFLRQNALIAILAQMGSFVPAEEAKIGIVSQLFSRVGASDDLARGRSTFMVEMVETAAILNLADQNAFVILDEIGRGTATYDGLSIAWATLEHLHEVNKCRSLFATHYHELTQLSSKLSGLLNATIAVREWEGEIIFLHEIKRGAADRSYGVQVAKLAGLPTRVVERARVVLEALEKGDREKSPRAEALFEDLPLFANPAPRAEQPRISEVETMLKEIQPDDMSPKDALALVYALKEMLKS